MRFASVYRQFTDVSSFMDELNKLVLEGKARGFQQIVQAAGSSEAASNLLVTEQLTKIVELQSGAIMGL